MYSTILKVLFSFNKENDSSIDYTKFDYLRVCYCLSYLLIKRNTGVTTIDDIIYYNTYNYLFNENLIGFISQNYQYLISLIADKVGIKNELSKNN